MASVRTKAEVLSVELSGGPTTSGSWKKWANDGGGALRDHLEKVLLDLGYSGEFGLVAIQGLSGGQKKFVRFQQIIANRNSIEIIAQLGSRMSRWKFELVSPNNTDVVLLFDQLKRQQSDEGDASDSEEDINSSEEESGLQEQGADIEITDSNVVSILPTEGGFSANVDAIPVVPVEIVSAPTSETIEARMASAFNAELVKLEQLAAEHAAAAQSIKDNAPEIEKLQREIADRQEMLRMYHEELEQSEAVLASKEHRAAAEKLKMIRAILES